MSTTTKQLYRRLLRLKQRQAKPRDIRVGLAKRMAEAKERAREFRRLPLDERIAILRAGAEDPTVSAIRRKSYRIRLALLLEQVQ